MATEMSDILSDKEPEAPVEPAAETPPVETQEPEEKGVSLRKQHRAKEFEAQGRDPDTGQYLPKEEPKVEAKPEAKPEVKPEPKPEPKQEFSDKERALLQAAQEERRKRQEIERRLAELEKGKPKEEEKKTFWDDPEGHLRNHEQRIAQREVQIRLSTSETIARSRHQDFDAVIAEFEPILQNTPGLHAQWIASQDPAEFAYRVCKHTKEVREAGSIDDLRAKIEKETRVKMEAEYKKKQEDLEKQRAELTPSLSEVRGASAQHKPVFNGPTPFDEILRRK